MNQLKNWSLTNRFGALASGGASLVYTFRQSGLFLGSWELGPRTWSPVPPVIQSQLNRQELPVANIIVPFCRWKLSWEECTGVESIFRSPSLWENCSYSNIRSIDLQLLRRIWMDEHWGCDEQSYMPGKCNVRFLVPEKLEWGRG